jgi:acyl-CoA synthetase (AMP-forming)/AMP-acid ligase II
MRWDISLRRERHFGDRVVSCFAERPVGVHAMLAEAVAGGPDREAVVDGETRLTYAGFDVEVARVTGGLASLGVGRGDRVALLLGNGIPFVVLTYAAARLGAATVPLSIRDQMPGIRHALLNSGARALVAEAEFTRLVPGAEETPALAARVAVGAVAGWLDYQTLRDHAPLAAAAETDEEAVATILYTSGTTGVPKGAMLTGLGIVHSATNFARVMALGPEDRTIVVAPMSHVTGLVAGIHSAIRAGGTIVVMREFNAPRFLELAARERMSFTVMVPAMYNLCLHRADLGDYDLGAWRIGAYGGAPMPAATIEQLAEALPGLGLMNAYGATETTSPATAMPPEHTAARRLSVGLPVAGAEIAVMDEDGREVPAGVHGEIWIRGAMVVPGYWRNEEATAREFVGGFWKSGDIGSIDADGFVYVHDRKKDMINRGGYKVFTAQVESVLTAFPGVLEAAVVAKPCPVLGERVHAVVSVEAGRVDEAAIAAHCAAQLADYQCPESYTLRAEPLPRNANGKIMKREIRAELGFADPA